MSAFLPFIPQTAENRAAIRTAIATLTAVLLAFKFHFETPYWSGMTVVITSNLYTGNIIDKALMRIIGTIAGAFLGFIAAGLVVNSFLLYLLTSFLLVAVAVYYYNFSRYAYAWLLGSLTALIIISQLAVNPQNVLYVAIWRSVEIALGVFVSSLFALSVFPNPIKKILIKQFDILLADLDKCLKQLYACLTDSSKDFQTLAESNVQLKIHCRKAVELIGAMPKDPSIKKENIDRYRALLESIYQLARLFQYQISQPIKPYHLPVFLPLKEVFHALENDISSLRFALKKPQSRQQPLQLQASLQQFELQFKKNRSLLTAFLPSIYSLSHFMKGVEQHLMAMKLLLERKEIKEQPSIYINAQKRLRNDPDIIKHSVRAGITIVLALLIWLASSWPGGINGIISSIVISVRKHLYEMKNISSHRFIGCFIGGGIALTSLALVRMNLYDFIVILLFSVWLFSYFSFKYPQYAYIGLQANIALIITLAQGGGPPHTLAPPLERLAGIIMGIIASFAVGNLLWRTDAWIILRRYLNKLFYYMTENLNTVLCSKKEDVRLHDLTNLFWLSRGLIETLSAQKLSAGKEKQLVGLRNRFEHYVIIQATISYVYSSVNIEKARTTAKNYDLPLTVIETGIIDLYRYKKKKTVPALEKQLQQSFAVIQHMPLKENGSDDELRNILAYLNALKQFFLKYI
ncbi:FUSC family protein [Legionella israelensis]|uniref:p-hydroxybenzoic acid efflux pump subunit AaeB n=1 Tax=Legionella israelensis TaxID=454 RepID=A0A0W0VXY1_9GAMM|nr:FUSC family protein [Legionella israelensis]KTD25056.1 p-hydroxybenzoic acid efflux pump subunit AaeB [Legionella israelensis]SCY18778.1 Uncharacterized membrane protein YccC [Legionella israelensis DSM 19235]STX57572.1 p-hydroxybenzoic acid efflux pump subunit AaeB [Legionella israelensis]